VATSWATSSSTRRGRCWRSARAALVAGFVETRARQGTQRTCWCCTAGVTSPRSATSAGPSRARPGSAARVRDGVALSPTARRGARDGGGARTAPRARSATSRRCPRASRSCATERIVRSCAFDRTDATHLHRHRRAMRTATPVNDRPSLGRRYYHGRQLRPAYVTSRAAQFTAHRRSDPGRQDVVAGDARLLRWSDALVVTSVKNDVIATTKEWRGSLGDVQVLEPGRDGGLTWIPLEGVRTLRHALASRETSRSGPPIAATRSSGTRWRPSWWARLMLAKERSRDDLRRRRDDRARDFDRLARRERPTEAGDVVRDFLTHDHRTFDGV
jgi:hypothetical protein